MPSWVPENRRWQLSRILSNTGCGFSIDSLMTWSTSAAAVCRSSVSRVSLNRRTFSIAITAWSAKSWSRSICRCGVSPGSGQAMLIAPIGTPSFCIGAAINRCQLPVFASVRS
jgi:hypothetical protein